MAGENEADSAWKKARASIRFWWRRTVNAMRDGVSGRFSEVRVCVRGVCGGLCACVCVCVCATIKIYL
jgi:hypothetical protein